MEWAKCGVCGDYRQFIVGSPCCLACHKKQGLMQQLKMGSKIEQSLKPRVKKERRDGLLVYGPVVAGFAYLKAASTRENEERSLLFRQLATTSLVKPEVFAAMTKWINSGIDDFLPGIDTMDCRYKGRTKAREDFDKWNSSFPKGVRVANERFFSRMPEVLTDRMLKKIMSIRMFLKEEKYDKAQMGKTDPSLVARCISAWCVAVNVVTGVPFSLAHHKIKEKWGDWSRSDPLANHNVLFPIGCNSKQLAEWFSAVAREAYARGMDAYEDDFTLFDSTQSPYTHNFLMSIYKRMGLHTWPWFERVRDAQGGECRGHTRHGLKFTEQGTMKSGSGDTCLGNTIVNYATHLFSTMLSREVGEGYDGEAALHQIEDLCERYNEGEISFPTVKTIQNLTFFMVLGDDNVTLVEAGTCMTHVPMVMQCLGLISKLKRIPNVKDVVFLNQWFLERKPGEFVTMPNFFRLMGKIGYSVRPQKDPMAYIHEVFQAFAPAFSAVTSCSKIIDHLVAVTGSRHSPCNKGCNKHRGTTISANVKKDLNWVHRIWATNREEPTPMGDSEFRRRCGLSVDQEAKVVDEYCSITTLPCIIGSGLVTALVQRLS